MGTTVAAAGSSPGPGSGCQSAAAHSSSRCAAVTPAATANPHSRWAVVGRVGGGALGKVGSGWALPTIAKTFQVRNGQVAAAARFPATLAEMKLATYKDGSRDGQLVVVARDLRTAHYATGTAHTLQQVLDDWDFIAPQLQDLYLRLNQGRARHAFAFEPARCLAPLPRAFQWLVAAAGPGRGGLPQLRQGSGDAFAGPHDDLMLHDEALAPHAIAALAVISGDLPAQARPDQALEAIRLLLLANDWCLRGLEPGVPGAEPPPQAWPATAFGPLAVTPDELGPAWQRGRLEAVVELDRNGQRSGRCDAGAAAWHFGQLLSQACRTRSLRAGTVLGAALGAITPESGVQEAALRWGDRVRIEIRGRDGQSLLGAIDQVLSPAD